MNHTSQHVCTHPRLRARRERALERLAARPSSPQREAEIATLKSRLGVA